MQPKQESNTLDVFLCTAKYIRYRNTQTVSNLDVPTTRRGCDTTSWLPQWPNLEKRRHIK